MQWRALRRWRISNMWTEEPKETWKGRKCPKVVSDVIVILRPMFGWIGGFMWLWKGVRASVPTSTWLPIRIFTFPSLLQALPNRNEHSPAWKWSLLSLLDILTHALNQGDPSAQACFSLFSSATRDTTGPWSCLRTFPEREEKQEWSFFLFF